MREGVRGCARECDVRRQLTSLRGSAGMSSPAFSSVPRRCSFFLFFFFSTLVKDRERAPPRLLESDQVNTALIPRDARAPERCRGLGGDHLRRHQLERGVVRPLPHHLQPLRFPGRHCIFVACLLRGGCKLRFLRFNIFSECSFPRDSTIS